MNERKIAIIGLGYVGLPLALALARRFQDVIGFDINEPKVNELRQGLDRTGETDEGALKDTKLRFTTDSEDLRGYDFFIISVPTPVDINRNPDLGAMLAASRLVAKVMGKGAIVVYESTVYPGVTEEVCGPEVERVSGLKQGVDFSLGYSPERINPGDREHSLERVVKVVAGDTPASLEIVADVYGAVIEAGVHRAPSIKVAEAAKVIENTQRDLNIALMNELAMIFDRMGIRTRDVLAAAGTKWNFLRFSPGLVGGHCIGVDPYYLTAKAESLGYHPQVILAGRRINDGMGVYVAQRLVKLMAQKGKQVKGASIGVLGLTFKENVPDLRNSRVPDIIFELKDFGVDTLVHDPLANAEEAHEEYHLNLNALEEFHNLDALVLAVSHEEYLKLPLKNLTDRIRPGGVIVDVKAVLDSDAIRPDLTYWSL